jgi:two-component system chemotaxis response regulator CheB
MPATFTGALARRLNKLCELNVTEVTRATPLQPGHVYIGRGDGDVVLSTRAGETVAMAIPASTEHRWHPSVDRLVESAMAHRPPQELVGVLMTGMGSDGADAMTRLRQLGGRTLAEAEESAVVWGMPGALVQQGGADVVAPLHRLADELLKLTAT